MRNARAPALAKGKNGIFQSSVLVCRVYEPVSVSVSLSVTKRIISYIFELTIIFKTWFKNKKTIHHAIKLTQSAWLKPWIGLNTDFRK